MPFFVGSPPARPVRTGRKQAILPSVDRTGGQATEQQILERARSAVEGFLRRQCANTALGVLSVNPEVDGYGDELLLVHLTDDDGGDAEGLPDSLARSS